MASEEQLEKQVEKFWRIDSSDSLLDGMPQMSINDKRVIDIWDKSHHYMDSHYELKIPFAYYPPNLQNNRIVAENRLHSLKKRFQKDNILFEKYKDGVHALLNKGYAETVNNDQSDDTGWYLPHHPVLNPNKPVKVLIVLDCAAKYQSISLNDEVLQGPNLTNKLVGVLLRFRQGLIAVMGDIKAMYHQVRVSPVHRKFLKFLWWKDYNIENELVVLRRSVHLFGGIWSPSCANYALKRTADDNKETFDAGTIQSVHRHFYVDDCLHSIDMTDCATRLIDQLQDLLAKGGFNIVKWISNSRDVIKHVNQDDRAQTVKNLDLEKCMLPTDRALGVRWYVELDKFEFSVKFPRNQIHVEVFSVLLALSMTH